MAEGWHALFFAGMRFLFPSESKAVLVLVGCLVPERLSKGSKKARTRQAASRAVDFSRWIPVAYVAVLLMAHG